MDVYLRTRCGAEQRITLDPRDPVPDWIEVTANTVKDGTEIVSGPFIRRFQLRSRTDRFPFRVYKERSDKRPGKHERVARYVLEEEKTNPHHRAVLGSEDGVGKGANACR